MRNIYVSRLPLRQKRTLAAAAPLDRLAIRSLQCVLRVCVWPAHTFILRPTWDRIHTRIRGARA